MSKPISDFDLERVRAEFAAGRKIEAIKLYRMATGADLLEAKQFVEALNIRSQGGGARSEPASHDDVEPVLAAIFAGQTIKAIKLHREATGKGLKEAKDFVEALEAELRRTQPTRFSAHAGNGCRTTVVCLLAMLAILVAAAAAHACGVFVLAAGSAA